MTFADITFITDDVMRLRAFYESVFGVPAEGDEWHSYIMLNGIAITFDSSKILKDTEAFRYVSSASANNMVMSFDVADVDAEYVRIVDIGAITLNQPTTHPWGARSFQFRDPDGNILNFRTVIQ